MHRAAASAKCRLCMRTLINSNPSHCHTAQQLPTGSATPSQNRQGPQVSQRGAGPRLGAEQAHGAEAAGHAAAQAAAGLHGGHVRQRHVRGRQAGLHAQQLLLRRQAARHARVAVARLRARVCRPSFRGARCLMHTCRPWSGSRTTAPR